MHTVADTLLQFLLLEHDQGHQLCAKKEHAADVKEWILNQADELSRELQAAADTSAATAETEERPAKETTKDAKQPAAAL